MRVLLVHNRYRSAEPSGENAVVDEEARLLAAAGCEVEVLETRSDDIAGWSAARRATVPGRVVWSAAGARLVRRAIARHAADVVHFHNTFPLLSPAALRAAHRSPAAVVQTLHNFRPLCAAGTFLREGAVCESCLGRLPLPAIRHGCYRGSRAATVPVAAMIAVHRAAGTWSRCVDAYVVPSAFAREKYLQAGWPAQLLEVKPNTVADPELAAPERQGGFAFVGRLAPEKGLDTLLAGYAAAFPEGGPGLELVGSGDLALEPPRGVTRRGRLDRDATLRAVAGARALVVPSRWYEVFPRVVVEAYALGVPVVATRIGSLAEIVEDGRTGLLVEPESAESLAAALRRLAGDDALRDRLAAGARRAYEERYAPAGTTAALLAIYERATARKAAGALTAAEATG